VLDIGGGTGAHAEWLAAAGFEVRLLDPVPGRVSAATDAGLAAVLGHACELPWDDDVADVTLLLGPLYDLVDPADRTAALAEAPRVTRPGGLVTAAAISRHASLLELLAFGEVDDDAVGGQRSVLETGINPPGSGFTTANFHEPAELARAVAAAGLRDVRVLGVEGPGRPGLLTVDEAEAQRLLASTLNVARMLESDPLMIASSPHLRALGRVPGRARRSSMVWSTSGGWPSRSRTSPTTSSAPPRGRVHGRGQVPAARRLPLAEVRVAAGFQDVVGVQVGAASSLQAGGQQPRRGLSPLHQQSTQLLAMQSHPLTSEGQTARRNTPTPPLPTPSGCHVTPLHPPRTTWELTLHSPQPYCPPDILRHFALPNRAVGTPDLCPQ
jgi:SAM-dependent methyltransferase